MTIQISIDLPEGTLAVLRETPEEFGRRMREAAVVKWYEMGILSQSKAAEILSVSRAKFLDVLDRYGVSACQVSEEEYETEFRP